MQEFMEGSLKPGHQLKTKFGSVVTIDQFLAEGGQGEVYIVDYNGSKKALKWYKKNGMGDDPQAFYTNIEENVKRGAPSQEFLWPIDITEWENGAFGYIMELRPQGYYEITDYMLTKQRFGSYKTVIDAALRIASAYRILHNAGYSYQDLNDGNFFIEPSSGRVLICDNDNVAPEGVETGILGKPRYMAPEIVLGESKPNSLSDRFSLSIILYLLFCQNHPLEGKRYLAPGLTPEMQEKLYGSEPLFMMDPDDTSNGPHEVVHANSIRIWECLPDYMREIFLKAFSQNALKNPSTRPTELDWINALTRFRSDIVTCECGNEIFTKDGRSTVCEKCGRVLEIPSRIDFRNYSIPAVNGSRIYRCQLGVCNETEALNPVAAIIAKKSDPNVIGIRNKSQETWQATTPSGRHKTVAPNEVVPVKDGIGLRIFNEPLQISKNG